MQRKMNEALERAKKLLADNRDKLDGLTELLMERETIDRAEFAAFMKGEALPAAGAAQENEEQNTDVQPAAPEAEQNAAAENA